MKMKTLRAVAVSHLVLGLILISISSSIAATDKPFPCDALERENYVHTQFGWQDVRPLEYLSYLRTHPANVFTVFGCKEGWVKEEDVPLLMEHLDSKEPCPNQVSANSSFLNTKRSTVGNEAAWLIQAFRVGRFPPGLNSTNNGPDPAELRRWWQERKQRASTQSSETPLVFTRER